MIRQGRLAFRIQRFEVVASIVVVAILGISAFVVRARLDAVGVPTACWDAWAASQYADQPGACGAGIFQFGLINGEEASKVMGAMAIVPFLVGLVLGVPLVSREVEAGTAPMVWALARSRPRWLLGRLWPIAALLVTLMVILAVASDIVWAGRTPWLPIPNFDDVGLHGSVLVGKGLAGLGIGLLIGSLVGRLLPTALLAGVAVFGVLIVASTLQSAWLQTESFKHAITVASMTEVTDMNVFPGGYSTFNGWVGADGEPVFEYEQVLALVPPGEVDPSTWIDANVPYVMGGVPASVYPEWSRIETAAFGGFGLLCLLLAFPVVDRRRPQ